MTRLPTESFDFSKERRSVAENVVWSENALLPKRADRVRLTGLRGASVNTFGVSGSGKSTIAALLEAALLEAGVAAFRLDGDNVRFGLCRDLGFSKEDRNENIRRVSETTKLLNQAGVVCIGAFINPYLEPREEARRIHEEDGLTYLEVYVKCPMEVAEARDPKGLYAKYRAGEIKGVTGLDDPFEESPDPHITIDSSTTSVVDAVARIWQRLVEEEVIDVRWEDAVDRGIIGRLQEKMEGLDEQ